MTNETRADSEFNAGERVYLGRTRSVENTFLHLERYRFSLGVVGDDQVVLDAASGSGYGTALLGQRARHVVGVDVSKHALAYARRHHMPPNVDYLQANLDSHIPLADGQFDAIVSFETLEHVHNYHRLLSEFRRLLKPGGLVILSTPDREIYSDRLRYRNRFHVRELSRPELLAAVSRYFSITEQYGQVAYAPAGWQIPLGWLSGLDFLGLRSRIGDRTGSVQWVTRLLRPFRIKQDGGPNITRMESRDTRAFVYLIVIATKI